MQLAHPEVAQLKLGALRPQVCHCSFSRHRSEPMSRTGSGEKNELSICQCLQPDKARHKVNSPRPTKVGIRGGKGRERAEALTLLVCVAHRLTLCNVSPKSRSLSKGVDNAARPPGGSPAELGSLTASSLPLFLFGASL